MTNKQHLPEKPCLVCGKPMVWRKKWTKVWGDVKYCSERCRRKKRSGSKKTSTLKESND